MVFGHNTNIKAGAVTFHVQTEDRGESHALIDTTVYFHGRVLHRRTNNYYDLLPLNEDREHAFKLRLDEQHHAVLDEIRSGALQLAIPNVPDAPGVQTGAPPTERPQIVLPPANEPRKLLLELMNANSWLRGKQARLRVSVREESGLAIAGAHVKVEIEGGAEHPFFSAETGLHGQAEIEFEMPRIMSHEAALVVRAEDHDGRGQLRFSLRAKPRVPAV